MGTSFLLPPPGQPVEGPDPTFKSAAVPNVVEFSFQGLAPPTALYLQRDDFILINASSSVASEIVQGEIRYMLPAPEQAGQPGMTAADIAALPKGKTGKIVTTQFTLNLSATPRTLLTKTFSLGECYLLSVSAQSSLAVQRGQTFVRASLNRGNVPGNVSTVAQFLFSDYVCQPTPVGWPGGRQLNAAESTGFLTSINVPNPAAGADWIFTVPVSERLRIVSFRGVLTTSATVANRQVAVFVTDSVNTTWITSAPTNIPAATLAQISGTGTSAPLGVITTLINITLPPVLILPPGFTIATLTTGIQAGDQWSSIQFSVEQWLDQI